MSGTTLIPYRASMRRLCQITALLSLLVASGASVLLVLQHFQLLALPASGNCAEVFSPDTSLAGSHFQWPIIFAELAVAIGLATAFLYDEKQPSRATLCMSRLAGLAAGALLYFSWHSGATCPYWLVGHLGLLAFSVAAEIVNVGELSTARNDTARNVRSCLSLFAAAALVSAALLVAQTELARRNAEATDRRQAATVDVGNSRAAERATPSMQDSAEALQHLRQEILAATVQVANLDENLIGSGVIVGQSGPWTYVLTAEHIVKRAARIAVSQFSSENAATENLLAAELVAGSREADLAVIRMAAQKEKMSQLQISQAKEFESKLPMAVFFSGYQADGTPICLAAEVTEQRQVDLPATGLRALMWQLNVSSEQGFSGGPLVDARGHLIGIASGVAENRAYFTHGDEIRIFLLRNGLRWILANE